MVLRSAGFLDAGSDLHRLRLPMMALSWGQTAREPKNMNYRNVVWVINCGHLSKVSFTIECGWQSGLPTVYGTKGPCDDPHVLNTMRKHGEGSTVPMGIPAISVARRPKSEAKQRFCCRVLRIL